MFKKLSAIIIAITIILVNTNCVNASILDIGSVATGLNGAFNLADSNEKKRSDLSNWLYQNSTWAGFMFDSLSFPNYLTPSVVWSVLPQDVKDEISDSSDETEVLNKTIDMILEGQSVSGNNITNNTNVNTFLKNVQNNYVSSNIRTAYTYEITGSARAFSSTGTYMNVMDKIPMVSGLQNKFYVVCGVHLNNNNNIKVLEYDLDQHPYLYVRPYTQGNIYSCSVYDGLTNTILKPDSSIKWNSTLQDWESSSENNQAGGVSLDINNKYVGAGTGIYNFLFTRGTTMALRYFPYGYTPIASDILYQPYYYNDTVWNDFSTSSGDYTFSPSNINTVTYGDTTTYIDSFNTEEGQPPSIPQINNYINQQNEQNVNTGGGSGGDGGGSGGNGGGSGSGNDGIFDFLSDLGSVLGNLISNLGQAITNIIKGISDLVTSIVTDLPTVFFDFVGSIFGWLPEEWVTLLSLSLAAMLIWGIVKVIRG